MAEPNTLRNWICDIDINGMSPLKDVKISEVFDTGIIAKNDAVKEEKFIPWSAIKVITRTGSYSERPGKI
ncbi:MAG: hypothetical protein ABSC17_05990 [Thermacetogeniaceae bacterium]